MPFVQRAKLGKKAKRALDRAGRTTWTFSPVTRREKNPKAYSRKKPPQDRDDPFFGGFFTAFYKAISGICCLRKIKN